MDKDEKRQEEKLEEQIDSLEKEEMKSDVSQEEFDQLKDLTTQLENNYKRALADYKNLERRTQEQKGEWIKTSNKNLILKMLPILDTLMLSLKHSQDKGLELSVGQFLGILEQEGVTRIKTVGEKFNPVLMEAITTVAGEEGKIIDEARSGYMMGEMVLRAAQVIVGNGQQ